MTFRSRCQIHLLALFPHQFLVLIVELWAINDSSIPQSPLRKCRHSSGYCSGIGPWRQTLPIVCAWVNRIGKLPTSCLSDIAIDLPADTASAAERFCAEPFSQDNPDNSGILPDQDS